MRVEEVEGEMKKVGLGEKVEGVEVEEEMFWGYKENEKDRDVDVYGCENEHGW